MRQRFHEPASIKAMAIVNFDGPGSAIASKIEQFFDTLRINMANLGK